MQEMQETRVWSLGSEDPLEEGKATHSSIPVWRILWTEGPGGLGRTESDMTEATKRSARVVKQLTSQGIVSRKNVGDTCKFTIIQESRFA